MKINEQQKIYVAGHHGMVGSAILRTLQAQNHENFVLRSRAELDLCNQQAVKDFFEQERPDQVYLAAAKVGGIHANNTLPADFIYQNLMVQNNIIHHAFEAGVKKLLFLGSSCIYPRLASQPMKECVLLTAALEPTNEPYAVAKIAGIKLCESYNRQHDVDYRSVMPTNLYGSGDNYHPQNSHVIPAMIQRFHDAKKRELPTVKVWGTGKPRREFLFVDDMALASVFIMNLDKKQYQSVTEPMLSHINVGYGEDVTISELAQTIAHVIGYKGVIEYDTSQPDGSPRKLMDSSKLLSLGWKPQLNLEQGLEKTYAHFISNLDKMRQS